LTFVLTLAIFFLSLLDAMLEQLIELNTPSGAQLYGDLRVGDEVSRRHTGKLPVVVVCHGFKAYKDWGPFPAIGRHLANAGFVSFVFNFSHNGIGREFHKFSEHKKFFGNTISLELDDVETVIDALATGEIGAGIVDASRIGIIGHSRGGGIAIVKGSENAKIKAVAAWSTVSHFDRYSERQRSRWRKQGYLGSSSESSQSPFNVGTALLDDLEENSVRLNIETAVGRLRKPLLLIHGTADIPVPIDEANRLYALSDKAMTEYVVLEGVGHMYGSRHPYKEAAPVMTHVLQLTTSWFHKHL
jgi:uncharacterized protein